MNILEQLYEGALNPADSVVYTDEYDCLQEKIEGLGDHIKRILQTDSERELCNEFLDVCNEQECEFGKISFCQGFSLATKIIMHSMGMQTEKPKDIWLETEEEKDNGRIPCQELLMERCMDISSTLTDASNSYRKNSKQHIGLMMELQRGEKKDAFSDYKDIWCDLSYAIAIPAYLYGGEFGGWGCGLAGIRAAAGRLICQPALPRIVGKIWGAQRKTDRGIQKSPSFFLSQERQAGGI